MRLEKHTPEEIDQAREESGFSNPSKEDMEEWTKLHEQLHTDVAGRAAKLGGVISLQGVILPLLSRQGLVVARGAGTSTVLELLKNKENGMCFPWYRSGLLGYEYITQEALKGMECEITTVLCRFAGKVIEIEKGDDAKLEYWVKRFAALFNHLADNDKIKYGILAPFMALPLANLSAESAGEKALRIAQETGAQLTRDKLDEIKEVKIRVEAESPTRRIALMVYPYTHLENEELNEWLGNPVFVEEGELGTQEWDGLPDVETD